MITRRYLLLSAIASLVGVRFALSSDEAAIILVLRKRLDYLRLDEVGVRAFARDLAATHEISSGRLKLVDATGPIYRRFDATGMNILSKTVRHGEERIVTDYLLSSDFFNNGSDESKIVRYLGMYDPLHSVANPFARHVS